MVLVLGSLCLLILIAHVKCVNSKWLSLLEQSWILEYVQCDNIDFTHGIPSLKRHQVVQRLRQQDLHLIVLGQLLDPVRYLDIGRQITCIYLLVRTNCSFNNPAHMKTKCEIWSILSIKFRLHLRLLVIDVELVCSSDLRYDLDSCDE